MYSFINSSKKPWDFFMSIQWFKKLINTWSSWGANQAKGVGNLASLTGIMAISGYCSTKVAASIFEVIWTSERPANTSWKSLAGDSIIFNVAFGKIIFACCSCVVPKVTATFTPSLLISSQLLNLYKFFFNVKGQFGVTSCN